MVPSYRRSFSSLNLIPLHLNQDQNHHLSPPNQYHSSSSFSSASLSYPLHLYSQPEQHQIISHSNPLQNEEAEKIIPSSGSWDDSPPENQQSSHKRKLVVWKKERNENLQVQPASEPQGGTSVKWLSSKMMVSDHQYKFEEDQKQPLSPLGITDTSSSSNNNYSNHTLRVCSDCHTTKTPLWRSGPRGPKSLCNACGIRQRKARRAMAAAAGTNGTTVVAAETTVKKNKLQQKKENKSKAELSSSTHMNKKKRKLVVGGKPISDNSQSRMKFGFEDLRLSLSKNLALQQVFPQDEKEAAILLMALSYGLVQG